jgi:hypothetical protein
MYQGAVQIGGAFGLGRRCSLRVYDQDLLRRVASPAVGDCSVRSMLFVLQMCRNDLADQGVRYDIRLHA